MGTGKDVCVGVKTHSCIRWDNWSRPGIASVLRVASILGISVRTVQRAIKNKANIGELSDRKRCGRNKILTDRQSRSIAIAATRNPVVTHAKMKSSLANRLPPMCLNTFRNYLKQHGMRSRKAKSKPLITSFQRRRRLAWARQLFAEIYIFLAKVGIQRWDTNHAIL